MEAERRQITVLFADVVGFTTFSERSGEEAAFILMRQLAQLMDEAVREQRGGVQGFTGDGIMTVFGAPIAFEDAPLRACRAAPKGEGFRSGFCGQIWAAAATEDRPEYRSGIVAWAQTRQTNGFIEAINGLFQAAKRKARGYTRFQTMKTVIFLIAGRLNFAAINPHAAP